MKSITTSTIWADIEKTTKNKSAELIKNQSESKKLNTESNNFLKVVNQEDMKNQPIISTSILFQLWKISAHLFLFSIVL